MYEALALPMAMSSLGGFSEVEREGEGSARSALVETDGVLGDDGELLFVLVITVVACV